MYSLALLFALQCHYVPIVPREHYIALLTFANQFPSVHCAGDILIVISWMFTGVVKEALFAKISSISVSHPLNFKHFLWHVKFLLQDTGGIT